MRPMSTARAINKINKEQSTFDSLLVYTAALLYPFKPNWYLCKFILFNTPLHPFS